VIAAFRLIGETEYKPVRCITLENSSRLPVTIEGKWSWIFHFDVSVQMSEKDSELYGQSSGWHHSSFIARHRPLRLKIMVETIHGDTASLVAKYVCEPFDPVTWP
jgi:hypothetical protein